MTNRRPDGGRAPVLAASVISGLAGYLILVVAARTLSPRENSEFLVFWSALFLVFAALTGLVSETTRSVYSARQDPSRDGARLSRILGAAALTTGVSVAIIAVISGPRLMGDRVDILVPALTIGAIGFTVHCGVAGALAGSGDWLRYARLVGGEATFRLVLVVATAVLVSSPEALAFAVAAAVFAWATILPLPGYRRVCAMRLDDSAPKYLRKVATTMGGSTASGLMIVGYPLLMRTTSPGVEFEVAAPLILAISFTRAPLLVPLGSYQHLLITRVLTRGPSAARAPVVVVIAASTIGIVAAWLHGPLFLTLIHPDYYIAGPLFGALVFAAALLALLTITGATLIGLDGHRRCLAGWVAATLVAYLMLLTPGTLESRTLLSLISAPGVGIAVHLVLIRSLLAQAHKKESASDPKDGL